MNNENIAFRLLVDQIITAFNYEYDDAEQYAKKLKDMALVEYNRGLEEIMITK